MNIFPLENLTIEEARAIQFKLVDSITRFFSGSEVLTRGDLGVVNGFNQPKTTNRVEKVLADFFHSEEALLVRGSGTNAIRLSLHSALGYGGRLLVHSAPIYPTTEVSLNLMGIEPVFIDFNESLEVLEAVRNYRLDGILIQVTRQKIDDSYNMAQLIRQVRKEDQDIPIITDDNYAALKTKALGTEVGANLSSFSTFKLLGPEGVGCIIGERKYIEHLRRENYSGGGQVQGHEALDVLRGMIYAPVSLAISAEVGDEVCRRLNNGEVQNIEQAFVINAQSRVVIVRLTKNISKQVIKTSTKLGALPNPVGAESKYEFSPLIYRVSSTFRKVDSSAEETMLRINPNRAGADTIIRILQEAMEQIKE